MSIRLDKRECNQIRQMSTNIGHSSRSDGSCKFSLGQSTVLCSVYGPMEVKQKDELLDKAYLSVIVDPLIGLSTTQERLMEKVIKKTVESVLMLKEYPRTMIKIIIQIMSVDGSLLSTAMNATFMALVDAGLSLNTSFSSITVLVQPDGRILLDPTTLEEDEYYSKHIFAFNQDSELVFLDSFGDFTSDQLFTCFDLANLACNKMHSFIRAAFERKSLTLSQ